MKVPVKLISLALAMLLLCGCSNVDKTIADINALGASPDDNYRTWYEIFVYSFCDTNGDGIGDLNGVRSKLDYLQEMGINGIWLMPIHSSTSYHKYNVSDYYSIDPTYGTMEDFDALAAECDARGIKLILDLVVNHSGSDHSWFTQMCQYLKTLPAGQEPNAQDCPYLEYYNLSTQAEAGYNAIPGTNFYYECRFSPDMPDLNLASPALRQEIRSIMEFWMAKGVDGFRLDAAKEFYSGNTPMNVEVLSFLQETATSIDPDAYLVAEVWDSFAQVTEYYTSGITSLFNFPFGSAEGKIVDVLRGAGQPSRVASFATALEKANNAYSGSNASYIDAPFLSNHDVGRIAGFVARDENKVKLAGAMNLFMSGSAFIYYGEELGMISGGTNDPSKRAPMVWNEAGNNGTTNPPPDCTLPGEYTFGSLEKQEKDKNSIYNYYRQAIAIRNALPVISHGDTTAETALNQGCISAQRKTWNNETCIILMNISEEAAAVDLSAYPGWTLTASLSANGEKIAMKSGTLQLPAWGVAVLTPGT